MIPSWQASLKNMVTDPRVLLDHLGLPHLLLPAAIQSGRDFKFRVTQEFVACMKPGDITDPLLRQVLPLGEELLDSPGFLVDPLGEAQVNPVTGLLHKYHSRVLLTVAGACAINCRYCFRRHFPYQENNPGRHGWKEAIDYIRADPSISEVIYSGGDPLLMTDGQLFELTKQISEIDHVKILRIHTRLPIVLPQRVSDEFLSWFTGTRLQPVMVIHCNHAQEISDSVKQAIQLLKKAGVTVFNQAVLLRGVNDAVKAQVDLSRALFNMGVIPYYLHVLDKVKGAAHFAVSVDDAKKIMQGLWAQLPGYLVPRLVQEVPGAQSKQPVDLGAG